MKLLFLLFLFWSSALAVKVITGDSELKTTVTTLLEKVYNEEDVAKFDACKQVPNNMPLFVCTRKDAVPLMKISSFVAYPFPLQPVPTVLQLEAKLSKTITKGSLLKLNAYSQNETLFDGFLDFCFHSRLVGLPCPVKKTDMFERYTETLLVPSDVPQGEYSFIATATDPQSNEYFTVAGIVKVNNPNPIPYGDNGIVGDRDL